MEQEVILWERNADSLPTVNFKMRIAVSNIDAETLDTVKRTVYGYAEKYKFDVLVEFFENCEEIEKNGCKYSLVFLGCDTDTETVFRMSKSLKINSPDTALIILSDGMKYVFDSFKIGAYRFLVKPVENSGITEILDGYFEKFGRDYPVFIKSGEDTYCLNTSQIYYIEADNKHCFVHLKEKNIPCRRTMACVFAVMPKRHFVKVNRAYIVNLNHVSRFNNDLVYFTNGDSVHISRNYLKIFKECYKEFLNPVCP